MLCGAIAREKPRHWKRIVRLVEIVQETTLGRIKRLEYRNGTYQRHIRESGSYLFRDETNTKYQWFYRYKAGKGKSAQIVNLPILTNSEKHDFNRIVLDGNHTVHARGGKFHVVFTQEGEHPVMKPEGKAVGGDLNCKNNLIAFSNGLKVRYDKAYLDRLIFQLQELDAKGEGKTRKDLQKLNKLCRRNQWYWQHLVHDILDILEAEGVTDIVLEDLHQFPATFLKHRQLSIKYSRLIRLLRISNLKNWFQGQALKRSIRVHLTQPHYTSQQCPKCGHIHRRNRKTQELFLCEECKHSDNADYNSSLNLVKRWTSDVLQSTLHSKDEFGRLIPKTMNKYRIRNVLENAETQGDFTVPFAPRVVCLKPLAA